MNRLIQAGLFMVLLLGRGGPAGAIVPPPKPPPVVPPRLIEPVEAMLRSADIGQPWQWEGLTVFPVVLRPVRSFGPVLTLEEALAKGLLTLNEIGGGRVNRVIAHNRSGGHVFLMAGEALGGAKQDRMVAEDILLPPHSRTEVAVWCVERGRWAGGKEFRSERFIAPAGVRQRAVETKSQAEVWASVSEAQRATGAPQGSLATVTRSEEVRAKSRPFQERLLPLPKVTSGVCGVVVAYGREWLAADLFYEPSLFERLWPRLLDSYLMETSGRPPRWGRPSVREAEEFLGHLFWAQRLPVSTPGAGRRIELRADAVYGSALIMDPSVVHLEAFPGAQILPERRPPPPPLRYRRERLF